MIESEGRKRSKGFLAHNYYINVSYENVHICLFYSFLKSDFQLIVTN